MVLYCQGIVIYLVCHECLISFSGESSPINCALVNLQLPLDDILIVNMGFLCHQSILLFRSFFSHTSVCILGFLHFTVQLSDGNHSVHVP